MMPKTARRLTVWGWILLALGVAALAIALLMAAQHSSNAWVNIGLAVIITINGIVALGTARRVRAYQTSSRDGEDR